MKYMDIKTPTTDAYENWTRWLNRMETELRTAPWYRKRKIEVKSQ